MRQGTQTATEVVFLPTLPFPPAFLWFLAAVSLLSVIVTVYDKWAAKHRPRRRIRERTLLLLAAAGGSVAMALTMALIRHKTRHKKFTVGIPLIIVLQAALLLLWIGRRGQ